MPLQGNNNWAGLLDYPGPASSNGAEAAGSFMTELMKTGYLIGAAYAYYQYCIKQPQRDSIPENGLPVVSPSSQYLLVFRCKRALVRGSSLSTNSGQV